MDQPLGLSKFSHYAFNAGENKGEPVTFLSKSELDRALNVENRGLGLGTRFGALVLNTDPVTKYPVPISVGIPTTSGFGFNFGNGSSETLYSRADKIYKNEFLPTVLKTGLTSGRKFQYAKESNICYMTNGIDPAQFYQPGRSTTQTYPVGYDTPTDPVLSDGGVGSLSAGQYSYYVTLYDQTTITESNRQLNPQNITIAGSHQIQLDDLPLDLNSRTTHWRIYRRDPTGYYFYDLIQIPYTPLTPSYTDNIPFTGQTRFAPDDNDKPDIATAICMGEKIMFYGNENVVEWSKPYMYQNVPTYNREVLDDDSNNIQKMLYYKGALIIWKSRSMYSLTGDFLQGLVTVTRMSGTIGTLSPETVKEAPEGIFFLGSDGKPRLITPTDFYMNDLRDTTDIAFKYRQKFSILNPLQYPNFTAVVFTYKEWSQYRLFVSVDTTGNFMNECWVYDFGMARRNGGDSAWFAFKYNINIRCAWVVREQEAVQNIYLGDDYGLLWKTDVEDIYFDGDEFSRLEDDGTVTYGLNTIDCSTATMGTNQYVGLQLILYDAFTFVELYRSRVVSNTTTQFILQDVLPVIPTNNPFITVGGYLTYFGTSWYTHDRAGRCRPHTMSMLLSEDVGEHSVYAFVSYDFYTQFNYVYDYINNPANQSWSPRTDIYLLAVGTVFSTYDISLYDTGRYGDYLYDTAEFQLFNKYLFNHASWGIITREPSRPFIYLGATLYYQYKALTRASLPAGS